MCPGGNLVVRIAEDLPLIFGAGSRQYGGATRRRVRLFRMPGTWPKPELGLMLSPLVPPANTQRSWRSSHIAIQQPMLIGELIFSLNQVHFPFLDKAIVIERIVEFFI